MTKTEFDSFLMYGIAIALILSGINGFMAMRAKRSWGLAIACLLTAVTLALYRIEAPRPLLAISGLGVLGCLIYDAFLRAAGKENPAS